MSFITLILIISSCITYVSFVGLIFTGEELQDFVSKSIALVGGCVAISAFIQWCEELKK